MAKKQDICLCERMDCEEPCQPMTRACLQTVKNALHILSDTDSRFVGQLLALLLYKANEIGNQSTVDSTEPDSGRRE
jgi:hypothetical protein